MNNYFRITAYHPAENISAILDSFGKFDKLWKFSSFLITKGFKIIEVSADDKFLDGDLPRIESISFYAPAATVSRKLFLTRLTGKPTAPFRSETKFTFPIKQRRQNDEKRNLSFQFFRRVLQRL